MKVDAYTFLVGAKLAMIVEIVVEQGALLQALRKTDIISMTEMVIPVIEIIIANDPVRITEEVCRHLAIFSGAKVVGSAIWIRTRRVVRTSSSTGNESKASKGNSHGLETHRCFKANS